MLIHCYHPLALTMHYNFWCNCPKVLKTCWKSGCKADLCQICWWRPVFFPVMADAGLLNGVMTDWCLSLLEDVHYACNQGLFHEVLIGGQIQVPVATCPPPKWISNYVFWECWKAQNCLCIRNIRSHIICGGYPTKVLDCAGCIPCMHPHLLMSMLAMWCILNKQLSKHPPRTS